jgi:Tol biopolymer transport system component
METRIMKCLLTLVLFALCAAAQQPSSAETLLQSGIKKETVDANLPGAIADYKKAINAARSDRAVAARALFQLAQCYRKQGDAQAKATLERIVREFAEQPLAAQARAQLASLAVPPNAGGMRLQKLVNERAYACSSVSFDGRLLGCAVAWFEEAAVYEIATGKMRILTSLRKETPANRFINTFAISPDGRTMALHIYRSGGVFSEIAFVPTDGSGGLKTVYKHPNNGWLDVVAWTPDGKEILTTLAGGRGMKTSPVLALNVATGATRTLREIPGDLQWVHTGFSPDGRWLAVNVPSAEPRSYRVEIWDAAGRTVSQVGESAGDGAFAGWSPDGKFILLSSTQGKQAELFKYPVSEGKVTGPPQTIRISVEGFTRSKGIDSNGTLYFTGGRVDSSIFAVPFDPAAGVFTGAEKQISSAAMGQQGFGNWSPDGKKFVAWSFEQVASQSITKPQVLVRTIPEGPETVATPESGFWANHMPRWDSEGKHLRMLATSGRGYVRLSHLDPISGKVTPASAPIPLTNINQTPDWSPDGRTLYQRKDGDLYSIDAQTGAEKLIYKHPPEESGVRNTTTSPDGKRLAFFGATRIMKSGGEWTGTSHWWIHVLDLATGAMKNIEAPHGFGFGASTLAWSPDGKYLVYAASGEKLPSLWIVPSDGSAPPTALSKPLGGRVMHIAFTPDGKTLSYSLMVQHEDVWMMSNFLGEAK